MHQREFKLFIFDVGGVLCDGTSVTHLISEYLSINQQEFIKLAKLSGLRDLQIGKITTGQFWENFSKLSGKRVEEDLWVKFFKPKLKLETAKLIEHLKMKYRVVAGTNTIEPHYRIHLENGDYRFFDRVYASHQIGHLKPDDDFFQYILEEESISPQEAFFVDDSFENVLVAQKLEICSVLFTNAHDLQSKLSSLKLIDS
ncbi:HAD-IA family hydrolase [Pseudothermotoga sp.]|uniref:HAD-IA family hydrolase n=1 Tax=Pseudothermotoga sp. TaxID=2033661 RepID=UPI0031F705E2